MNNFYSIKKLYIFDDIYKLYVIMKEETKKEIQIETKSYIIKELLRNCHTTEEFKKYYDYITNLMVEEKVYSLSTFIK
jgi:hypothetical protein